MNDDLFEAFSGCKIWYSNWCRDQSTWAWQNFEKESLNHLLHLMRERPYPGHDRIEKIEVSKHSFNTKILPYLLEKKIITSEELQKHIIP